MKHAYLIPALLVSTALAQPMDPNMLQGLVWRNLGPFRGGRVAAVTGAIGESGTFYIGLPQGGVWKTTSAGQTWYPVFDSIKDVCSVGAVTVAPSDPNIVYAGTGDMTGGNDLGNGVYKSTDAGKTWQHIGLEDSKQIPRILVDPHDPNIVLVAAEGDSGTLTETRGIYRSDDGGKTWKRTLFADNETGGQDISWAYDNPKVMLASTMRRYFAAPGKKQVGTPPAHPKGTALYKSTDEGLTWTEISGHGLPNLNGRTCTAVAMNTNSQRMFIIGGFGLYRSDDGGENWHQMAARDTRIRNGQGNYTSGVYVDSQNPDIVYTLATCSYRSLDGGNTFTGFKGAPGGDDPQQLWIDPTNGKHILLGGDQGATISLDGGLSWGLWYNQPTAQVYHIAVDNQVPYWVYATQQDSGSIATSSRGIYGQITPLDWLPHPGSEFGYVVPDPLNPRISYSPGSDLSGIVRVTYPTGQWLDVSPQADASLHLRGGGQPLAFSPSNPHELLAGFQYLMSTTDGGMHWTKLGPDLTLTKEDEEKAKAAAKKPAAQPKKASGNSAEEENSQFGFGGAAITSFSASSVAPGTIWVATSNRLIKVTKDHGRSWEDVSTKLPGAVSVIDASHTDPAAAYIVTGEPDGKPSIYRTRDYGKSWTKIVSGLPEDSPSGSFVNVVRADTVRDGLLFAGTESAMFVSFDDGDHWQPLMLNLPNTSYKDIVVHGKDLVIGTYGRGLWVLDDISPLREMKAASAAESVHLFKPGEALRYRQDVNGDTPFPPEVPHALNPPLGAEIYYSLGAKPAGPIAIDILDSHGRTIRHMTSVTPPPSNEPPPAAPDFWAAPPRPLPTEVGLNRVNWDIRYDAPPAFSHDISYFMPAVPGDTPLPPEGMLALPGEYTVRLSVDGKTYEQKLTVMNDPRSPASAADLRRENEMQVKLYDGMFEAWNDFHQVADMRASIAVLQKGDCPKDVATAAKTLDEKLAKLGGNALRGRPFSFNGNAGSGTPSFVALHTALQGQYERLLDGDMAPPLAVERAFEAVQRDMKNTTDAWATLKAKDIAEFNALLSKNNMKPLS